MQGPRQTRHMRRARSKRSSGTRKGTRAGGRHRAARTASRALRCSVECGGWTPPGGASARPRGEKASGSAGHGGRSGGATLAQAAVLQRRSLSEVEGRHAAGAGRRSGHRVPSVAGIGAAHQRRVPVSGSERASPAMWAHDGIVECKERELEGATQACRRGMVNTTHQEAAVLVSTHSKLDHGCTVTGIGSDRARSSRRVRTLLGAK